MSFHRNFFSGVWVLTLAKRNKLPHPFRDTLSLSRVRASIGLLVLLGFAVADFTPAAYQRHRL